MQCSPPPIRVKWSHCRSRLCGEDEVHWELGVGSLFGLDDQRSFPSLALATPLCPVLPSFLKGTCTGVEVVIGSKVSSNVPATRQDTGTLEKTFGTRKLELNTGRPEPGNYGYWQQPTAASLHSD